MNKTLLLILVDFLLLTILSMWKMDEETTDDAPAATNESTEVNVSAMAMMEQDLLDTLKYSLDEEKDERANLAEDLSRRAEELEKTRSDLEEREARIQNLQEDVTAAARRESELAKERENLQKESENLAEQIEQKNRSFTQVEERLRETELEAQQRAAQSRILQEELEKKLTEIERKEAALAEASTKLGETQKQVQELNIQVRMSTQQNEFLQESVSTLKGEVTAEREERVKLQEQAGKLAEGVTQLAENSQDLRAEIRSSIPVNANQLFSEFKNNQVTASFRSLKYQRNRYMEVTDSVNTVLVSDGQDTYALYHADSGPIGLDSNAGLIRSAKLELSRRGVSLPINRVQFLALDPRIMAVKLSEAEAARLGGKAYLTALDPFKWEGAVLVNRQGSYYGEVEFKLDAQTPGYVKMQTKILSSIFGEFSPSTGDLVLSKTGELLGIMVNRRYCVLIDNFLPTDSIELGDTLNANAIQRALNKQANLLDSFPGPLK